jgi:hypothetical protein
MLCALDASVNLLPVASDGGRMTHAFAPLHVLNVQWAGFAALPTLAIRFDRIQPISLNAHVVRMEDRCIECA